MELSVGCDVILRQIFQNMLRCPTAARGNHAASAHRVQLSILKIDDSNCARMIGISLVLH